MMRKALLCLFAVCLAAAPALSGCGVKPKNVKPPEGASDYFPGIYPPADHPS